jgi:hypothetical protein
LITRLAKAGLFLWRKLTMDSYQKYDEDKLYEMFHNTFDTVTICGVTFDEWHILKEMDPMAYNEEFSNWEDGIHNPWICRECENEFDDETDADECCAYECPICGTRYDNEDDADECCQHICPECGIAYESYDAAQLCCFDEEEDE